MTYVESEFAASFIVFVDFFYVEAGHSDALRSYANLISLREIRITFLVPKDFEILIHIKRFHLLVFLNVPDQDAIFPVGLFDDQSDNIFIATISDLFDPGLCFSSVNIEADPSAFSYLITSIIDFHVVKI